MKANRFLTKLSQTLFTDPCERESFINYLENPGIYPEAIVWLDSSKDCPFKKAPSVPWQPPETLRIESGQSLGKHILHEEGAFYCLDFSSVFAASVLQMAQKHSEIVLDMCAAPGGKSILAFAMLQPDRLVANEFVSKRVGSLIGNLKRCKVSPSFVLNRDPKKISPLFESACELVLVDAPCSGQSLLVKGEGESGAFHPSTINMNHNRQRRILSDAAKTVAPGGMLAYMTCTFSIEENEKIVDWFLKKNPEFSSIACDHLKEFRSAFTDHFAYRLFPHQGLGAGAFTCLFIRESDCDALLPKIEDISWAWQSERAF